MHDLRQALTEILELVDEAMRAELSRIDMLHVIRDVRAIVTSAVTDSEKE